MSLFKDKQSVSRGELKSALEKSSGRIPKTGGEKYYRKERLELGRETFGRKYGSQISKGDYKDALRDLKSAKNNAKTRQEKRDIDEKIRYLKELGGFKY